jgi:dTDP-4-dehydrorhamnose reductase
MINVLIMGITGMLGSMVYRYLSLNDNLNVIGTTRDPSNSHGHNIFQFNANNITEKYLLNLISKTNPDYVINCIGIINKYCTLDNQEGIQNAILINSLFPHKLSNAIMIHSPNTKILQIATDCVYSGNKGNYTETDIHDPVDIYGKSKLLGEVVSDNFLNIRCSIIGPELNNKSSLLEWFLAINDREVVSGYNHHFWNGVTTLQFAQLCERIIIGNEFDSLRKLNHLLHYCINESVSKYELLLIFREVFKKNISVTKIDESKKMDRTLASVYLINEKRKMFDSLLELNNFIFKTNYYQ